MFRGVPGDFQVFRNVVRSFSSIDRAVSDIQWAFHEASRSHASLKSASVAFQGVL